MFQENGVFFWVMWVTFLFDVTDFWGSWMGFGGAGLVFWVNWGALFFKVRWANLWGEMGIFLGGGRMDFGIDGFRCNSLFYCGGGTFSFGCMDFWDWVWLSFWVIRDRLLVGGGGGGGFFWCRWTFILGKLDFSFGWDLMDFSFRLY